VGNKTQKEKGKSMKAKIVEYEHHGKTVKVQAKLKGKHREHCLCWQGCKKFDPSGKNNCPRAAQLYAFCRNFNMVTPVWECAEYRDGFEDLRKIGVDKIDKKTQKEIIKTGFVECVVKNVTNEFCEAFKTAKDCEGFTARFVGLGRLPQGVDFEDPRVQSIILRCQRANQNPLVKKCAKFGSREPKSLVAIREPR